ncbi:hypothetical protein [Ornithinimicrobium kibberense]|uniref:hypothetical protein n=1 Tax=Ornithinimicrobium kibberense TaxID=282060 RepID=UPI003613438C
MAPDDDGRAQHRLRAVVHRGGGEGLHDRVVRGHPVGQDVGDPAGVLLVLDGQHGRPRPGQVPGTRQGGAHRVPHVLDVGGRDLLGGVDDVAEGVLGLGAGGGRHDAPNLVQEARHTLERS